MAKFDILTARRRDNQQPRGVEVDANGSVYTTPTGGAVGAVTIADGADVAQGTTTDAEAAVGNGTVIALLKRLRTLLGGTLSVQGTWAPGLQSDETINDSDKEFTVPADTEWQILSIWVELITTATVGDRQLVVQIQDASDDVIGEIRAGAVQAASLTRNYLFAAGCGDLTSFRDTDYLMTPVPPTWILPAGFDIRVYDNNAVAVAADDMVVQMMVAARSV